MSEQRGTQMKKNSLGFRLLRLVTFWVTGNLTAIFAIWHAAVGWKILVGILCGILFLFFQFAHVHTIAGEKKLASLAHGCDLLRTSTVWFCLELLTAGALFWSMKLFWVILLIDLGVFSLLCWFTVFQGLLHIALHSTQVKLPWHVALFFLWWVPPLNLFLMGHVYRTAKRELQLECAKAECNVMRKESEICKTRYPILLVHGIFFRDWQFFNYWGRIPAELIRNGATIFYGKQQSAQSISVSAKELAAQIQSVIAETGAEKGQCHCPFQGRSGLPLCHAGIWCGEVCGFSDNDQYAASWLCLCGRSIAKGAGRCGTMDRSKV